MRSSSIPSFQIGLEIVAVGLAVGLWTCSFPCWKAGVRVDLTSSLPNRLQPSNPPLLNLRLHSSECNEVYESDF